MSRIKPVQGGVDISLRHCRSVSKGTVRVIVSNSSRLPEQESVRLRLPNSSYRLDRKGTDNDFDTCRKLGMPLLKAMTAIGPWHLGHVRGSILLKCVRASEDCPQIGLFSKKAATFLTL